VTSGGLVYLFCSNFIAGCSICQQNKVLTHPVTPPLNPIKSTSSLPFKQLSVDLITDLPLSNGYDSLMVVVDHGLTKGVILTPCSKPLMPMVLPNSFSIMYSNDLDFMTPSSLIRGPQFASAFARELARILKYDVRLSTAYHPQTDGQTERPIRKSKLIFDLLCQQSPQMV
jgi:hypothetical protein